MLALFAAPPAAMAQPAAKAPAPALVKPGKSEAATLAEDAKKLLGKKQIAEACGKLAESARLEPKGDTMLAHAQCRAKNGETVATLVAYRALFAFARANKQKGFELAAAAAMSALERKVSTLTIAVPRAPPGLVVRRDGAAVERAQWGEAVPIEPGAHTVDASAPDRKPWAGKIDVAGGAAKATITVPALEDGAPVVVAEGPPPAAPLKAIGDVQWTEGAGFVRTADAPHDEPSATPLPAVPKLAGQDLGNPGLEFNIGMAMFQSPVQGVAGLADTIYAPRMELAARPEFRSKTSLFAVWFDAGISAVVNPNKSSSLGGVIGAAAHLGLDWHPYRAHWIAVGPFAGYRVGLFGPRSSDPSSDTPLPDYSLVVDHGPEIGPIHVRFRTAESAGSPPVFDADAYLIERASRELAGTFVGLKIGLGGQVRFRAGVDYRVAQQGQVDFAPDRSAFEAFALSLPQRLQVNLGIGGGF